MYLVEVSGNILKYGNFYTNYYPFRPAQIKGHAEAFSTRNGTIKSLIILEKLNVSFNS